MTSLDDAAWEWLCLVHLADLGAGGQCFGDSEGDVPTRLEALLERSERKD